MTDTTPVIQEPEAAPEPDKFIVQLADRVIDLRRALPLRSKDYIRMEANPDETARVTLRHIQTQDFSFSRIATFVEAAVTKVDPAITRDQVEDLPFPDLARAFAAIMEAADQGISRPTSTSSSSPPKPGDGDQQTWAS